MSGYERPEAILTPAQTPSGGDDPVSEEMAQAATAAKEAFSRRSPGEVAVLVYDSLVDANDAPEHHELRFETDRLRFVVHVSVRPADVGLVGRVDPPAAGRFELVLEDGDLSFVQDSSDGTFHFEPMGHGLVRLAFNAGPARRIQTDWFRV